MNCLQLSPDTTLVDLVAFKWLMAGRGWWVDLPRLERDPAYALICAQRGADSGLALLRQRSAQLQVAMTPSPQYVHEH